MSLLCRKAFSLLELVVVVAVVAVLVSIILPAAQQARESINRLQCQNNLKQMGIALHMYHDAFRAFPPAAINPVFEYSEHPRNFYPSQPPRLYGHTGFTLLLPYLEEENLYKRYRFDYPSCNAVSPFPMPGSFPLAQGGLDSCPDNANAEVVGTYVRVYHCPSEEMPKVDTSTGYEADWGPFGTILVSDYSCTNARRCNYLFNTNECLFSSYPEDLAFNPYTCMGMFGINGSARKADIRDGLSQTIAMGEARQEYYASAAFYEQTGFGPFTPHWGAGHLGNLFGIPNFMTEQVPINALAGDDWFVQMIDPMTPSDPRYRLPLPFTYSSKHKKGVNFVFADGSVHFLTNRTSAALFFALSSIREGVHASLPD